MLKVNEWLPFSGFLQHFDHAHGRYDTPDIPIHAIRDVLLLCSDSHSKNKVDWMGSFSLPPTDIHLPLTHWATPFTFLEVGVFCRETIKNDRTYQLIYKSLRNTDGPCNQI
jgi:hypothetical protein